MEITSEILDTSNKNYFCIKYGIYLCSVCAIIIFLITVQNLPVVMPILVAASSIIFFFFILKYRKRGLIPIFELGAFYVLVVGLYTLYPLIGFLANGLAYSPFNDSRLFAAQPTPQQIGVIGWYYTIYLVSFIIVYLISRGRLPLKDRTLPKVSRVNIISIFSFYLIIKAFFLLLNSFYDLSYRNYAESYLVYKRLPIILAQLVNHLGGASFTLEIMILAFLFQNYRRYRIFIFSCLSVVVLTTFFKLGSRTELFLLLVASAMLYNTLVKPIKFNRIVFSALLALFLFTILGILRSNSTLSILKPTLNPFAYSSEFEAIFANAYDLSNLKAKGAVNSVPLSFYLADFLALIPQQLLPFTKIDPSDWYAKTFYPEYAAQGGGLALGAISESILGFGWIDLIWRGSALGFIFARIHRYYSLGRPSFWKFNFYIWTTVLSYQLFRSTTFSLLSLFFYRFLSCVLVIKVFSTFLKNLQKNKRELTS